MKVLALTWEFPPVITGGLGMACYGIVKALLNQGTEVDLIMPAKEAVYFPLKNPADADNLPAVFVESKKPQMRLSEKQLQKLIGSPLGVYFNTGRSSWTQQTFAQLRRLDPFKCILETLSDQYYLFRQVRQYTEMAVDISSRLQFDVIHAHDWLTYPAAMILKKLTGIPLVTHVHATEFDRAGGAGDGRIHNIEYLGMDYADRVIAVSSYTASTIAQKYLVRPDKIRVVHNAYSTPAITNNHRRIFREPTILFMGRITLQKGPDYFLEVARRVLQHEKNIRFIMAGSGDMERTVLHRAASFGLGTKFLVAGFLDRNEVDRVLATTDIFILPSVSEPFGIAPLEAMSHGAVAIVSKNSGVAEIIDNAYKVDFWDIDKMVSIIIDLIRNPHKMKEMARRGREEVANLQWEQAAEKIINVYKEAEEMELACLT